MRGQGGAPVSPSEGTAVVTRTERTDVIDAEAPPGAHLFYSVFAARGGETWSPPAIAPPAMFTPEVTDVSVAAADTSVAASWRPHPGADGVLVVRRENDPPRARDDGTSVEASLTGFTDSGLRTGTEYYYRIVACYRPSDGQRRYSAGVVTLAVPEPVPRAVTDLDISGPGEDAPLIVASWTPPPYGQVRLVRSDQPPPWTAGTRLTPADSAGLREIPGVPRRGTDGRDVLELRLPPGHHHILALTAGRNASVTGNTAEVRLVEPVRGLSAERMHDEVRLGWIWPDGATDAVICWPGGERHCSRRVYDDEGGAVLTVGAAETTVEVRAIYPQRGGRLTAPATRVQVPGRGVAVTYRIRRTSRWHPRQRTIELAAEQATQLPGLVVVRSTGRYVPDHPSEGETVARVGPQNIAPGQTATFLVEVPKGPAWLACFVDPRYPRGGSAAHPALPPARGGDEDTVKLTQRHTTATARIAMRRSRSGRSGSGAPAGSAATADAARRSPTRCCGTGPDSAARCHRPSRRWPPGHGRLPGLLGRDHHQDLPGLPQPPPGALRKGRQPPDRAGGGQGNRQDRLHDRARARADAPDWAAVQRGDHRGGRLHPAAVRQRVRTAAVPRGQAAAAHHHGGDAQPGTARVPLYHREPQRCLRGPADPQRTLLSFFDTAGEDLRSQQSIEENVRYLGAADGILLLLDPLQMRGARELAKPGTRLPTPDGADEPATVLENVTDLLLASEGKKPNKRIDKPLAIVFTKMDTLLHDLKETSPLLRSPSKEGYFDEHDSLEVHAEIQRLLARWEGSRIDQIARLHYRRYRYFGVSALGETPTKDNRVAARGIRPYRVASPILWILGHFGIVPVK